MRKNNRLTAPVTQPQMPYGFGITYELISTDFKIHSEKCIHRPGV